MASELVEAGLEAAGLRDSAEAPLDRVARLVAPEPGDAVAARGPPLFSRFRQPDADPVARCGARRRDPSAPRESPLRLHGLALAAPWTRLLLGSTGGTLADLRD